MVITTATAICAYGFCSRHLLAGKLRPSGRLRWRGRVDFPFCLARNKRLVAEIKAELAAGRPEARQTGKPARRFKDFRWSTLKSWSCRRRAVAKAEWTQDEANPRFVVTSLTRGEAAARWLYETIYCARGENRIKECQLDLFADRTSAATMRANQLRLQPRPNRPSGSRVSPFQAHAPPDPTRRRTGTRCLPA